MFYSQVVLNGGLPFVPRLPTNKPLTIGKLSEKELSAELAEGIERGRAGIARGEYLEGADAAIEWAKEERLARG